MWFPFLTQIFFPNVLNDFLMNQTGAWRGYYLFTLRKGLGPLQGYRCLPLVMAGSETDLGKALGCRGSARLPTGWVLRRAKSVQV